MENKGEDKGDNEPLKQDTDRPNDFEEGRNNSRPAAREPDSLEINKNSNAILPGPDNNHLIEEELGQRDENNFALPPIVGAEHQTRFSVKSDESANIAAPVRDGRTVVVHDAPRNSNRQTSAMGY